ncbi:diguanylate cyclase domain-containing protein [Paraglaciecola aestuariivivens]
MNKALLFALVLALKVTVLGIMYFGFSLKVQADGVNEFILQSKVTTYDCPADEFIPKLEHYLQQSLTASQRIQLLVHKSHWLICMGKNDQAYQLLNALLAKPELEKGSESHASILYQLGFILDVQDNPKRCDFYQQAEQLAKDSFNDIYLSAKLGLITVCQQDQDLGVKLGRLFALLKRFTLIDDQAAIAHIHNSIGLMFSAIGQMSLAAQQYEKSYQIGLNVYEEKNQLAPLISVITAYSGSGDYQKVAQLIQELGERNLAINTPLTNNWFHFAQSRHAQRTGDYELLRQSLRAWQVFIEQISNQTMQKLFNWYRAVLCLHDQDKICVASYLASFKDDPQGLTGRLARDVHFIGFLVKAQLFLGDLEAAKQSFENYQKVTQEKVRRQQSSARVLGVAHLHNEIIGLETSLAEAEQKRWYAIALVIILTLVLLGLGYYIVRNSQFNRHKFDKLTELLSQKWLLAKIRKVKKSQSGKVNALGVLELTNIQDIIQIYGAKVGQNAIKQIADALKQITRKQEMLGRVKSNLFLLCLANVEDKVASELFARIQQNLERVILSIEGQHGIEICTSIHIYNTTNDLADIHEVLAEISQALNK